MREHTYWWQYSTREGTECRQRSSRPKYQSHRREDQGIERWATVVDLGTLQSLKIGQSTGSESGFRTKVHMPFAEWTAMYGHFKNDFYWSFATALAATCEIIFTAAVYNGRASALMSSSFTKNRPTDKTCLQHWEKAIIQPMNCKSCVVCNASWCPEHFLQSIFASWNRENSHIMRGTRETSMNNYCKTADIALSFVDIISNPPSFTPLKSFRYLLFSIWSC